MHSDTVSMFINDVHNCASQIGFKKYSEVLNQHGIEWSTDSMSNADVTNLPSETLFALLLGTVRAERFCDGALLGFLENGCVRKWLIELRKREESEMNQESMTAKKVSADKGDTIVTFLYYPKCSTCQKARKWLDDNGIEYESRDIKLDNPTLEELMEWYKKSSLPLKKFFNTSGLLYKSLDLKNKLPGMTEEEMIKLLATDGMLVKRPLVIGNDFVLVGFKEAEWKNKV